MYAKRTQYIYTSNLLTGQETINFGFVRVRKKLDKPATWFLDSRLGKFFG